MANEKIDCPFGLKDKLGYMFGDFGNDFTFILSSSFLMNLREILKTDKLRQIMPKERCIRSCRCF